ncbi:diguanylate cyclase (GGDEF) domain-containing protein [Clostridium cylindrosporum DSM 605]|uniref:Diguanylate cyclase (GGDEF) domain-containing protein n=2 Tax=Clostridium cylindrosporum TaxID=1495 RepID=A0A0J8DF42_CLOCY|nr:diguanylate cyclase (GGDEF) domain-containing protein [Clostridium cylindrosporum DSM 605]
MLKDYKYQVITTLAISFMVILISIAFFTNYIVNISRILKEETNTYLSEISNQSVITLQKQIKGDIKALENISQLIGAEDKLDVKGELKKLKGSRIEDKFIRMGIILPNGEACTTDEHHVNLSDREYFKKAMKGEANLSEPLIGRVNGKKVSVYAAPIYKNESIIGVIYAEHEVEIYNKILAVSTFGGKGYSYVVKKTGETILRPNQYNSLKDFNLVGDSDYSVEFIGEHSKDDMLSRMAKGKSGNVNCKINGLEKYMSYTPIEINDWYLLSVIPEGIVSEKISYIKSRTLGIFAGIIIVFSLITMYILYMQRISRDKIYKIAFIDPLTGANTLSKFKVDVKKIIESNYHRKYAIIQFDIDRFKHINDRFGYEEGNNTLRFISDTLKSKLKSHETFARINADKFVLLLSYEKNEDIINKLIDINSQINTYKWKKEGNYEAIISFGIYKIDKEILDDSINITALIDKASIAKKVDKGYHRTTYTFYSDSIYNNILKEKEIETYMNSALENKEFVIYFQPKYSLKDLSIVGAEALVRWNSKENGIISPGEFIPLFEKNGFILDLDMYVFEEVCKTIRSFIDRGVPIIPISVNVSRVHLNNKNFIEMYKELADKYNINPSFIEIEITESAVFGNTEILLDIMNSIKKVGFSISMDDFGAGYSSLNLLKDLPVDILKLDREFFKEVNGTGRWKQVVLGIVSLAKSMGIKVVSEGVETEEQSEFLEEIGCDMAQGYLFSKPVPISEFKDMLMTNSHKVF